MVQQLLAAWRDAERRLAETNDPAAAEALRAEVERLRNEYRAAVDAASAAPARSSNDGETLLGA